MPVLKTTGLELQASLTVAADCSIIFVVPDADISIRNKLTNQHRIIRVGNIITSDRSELRNALVNLPDDKLVEVEYELISDPKRPSVPIQRTVEFNKTGEQSNMKTSDEFFSSSQRNKVTPKSNEISNKVLNDFKVASDKKKIRNVTDMSSLVSSLSKRAKISSSNSGNLSYLNATKVENQQAEQHEQRIDITQETMQQRLKKALNKVELCRCVICICVDVNPISAIELVSVSCQKKIYVLDCAIKVKARPRPEQIASEFLEAVRSGTWFVVLNGTKSINTLQLLESLMKELHERKLNRVHPEFRCVISMEPHPHFPRFLAQNALIMKFTHSFSCSTLQDSMLSTSVSRMGALTGMRRSQLLTSFCDANCKPGIIEEGAKPRRVRMAASVDIIDIEPRDVFVGARNSNQTIDVSDSVVLNYSFTGVPGDKFLCISNTGVPGRYAVGSSFGNVYFLDSNGASLMQTHLHEASIWDISFKSKDVFCTAVEDGTAVEWQLPTNSEDDDSSLTVNYSLALGGDVYTVEYINGTSCPALATGGLGSCFLYRSLNDGVVHKVSTSASVQMIKTFPHRSCGVFGGGGGKITIYDFASQNVVNTLSNHTKKVPTIAIRNESSFFSGSFDCSVRSWDARSPKVSNTITLKMKNYVTGLDVDDNYLAGCVGENLYLWDVRKLSEILGAFSRGWKGLSRGAKINTETKSVITASPDRCVRFWKFN